MLGFLRRQRLWILVIVLFVAAVCAWWAVDTFVSPILERMRSHCVEDSSVDHDCLVAEYTKALARFTFSLVLVTFILGVGTFIAAMAAVQAAGHIPRVERAISPVVSVSGSSRARGLVSIRASTTSGKRPLSLHGYRSMRD